MRVLPKVLFPVKKTALPKGGPNVPGEPVFISVMATGWVCEKSGWIGKVEDVKPVLF